MIVVKKHKLSARKKKLLNEDSGYRKAKKKKMLKRVSRGLEAKVLRRCGDYWRAKIVLT